MTDLNLRAGSEDFQCLYGSPVTCDAVKWSEDNLLAISTESGVSLLSPCDLAGSRQYATPAEQLEGRSTLLPIRDAIPSQHCLHEVFLTELFVQSNPLVAMGPQMTCMPAWWSLEALRNSATAYYLAHAQEASIGPHRVAQRATPAC